MRVNIFLEDSVDGEWIRSVLPSVHCKQKQKILRVSVKNVPGGSIICTLDTPPHRLSKELGGSLADPRPGSHLDRASRELSRAW